MKSNADRIEFMRFAVCNELREARKAYKLRNLPKLSIILERVNGYYRAEIISELTFNRIWDMYSLLRYGVKMR